MSQSMHIFLLGLGWTYIKCLFYQLYSTDLFRIYSMLHKNLLVGYRKIMPSDKVSNSAGIKCHEENKGNSSRFYPLVLSRGIFFPHAIKAFALSTFDSFSSLDLFSLWVTRFFFAPCPISSSELKPYSRAMAAVSAGVILGRRCSACT